MTTHFVIAGHLLDERPSGASRRLLSIARELRQLLSSDERVTILHGAGLTSSARFPGVEWRRVNLPSHPTWRRVLAERRRLGRELADIGADVADLGTLPVPAGLPCPIVLTIHDLRDLDPRFARRSSFVARRIVRRSVRRATEVIVPSQFTAEQLRLATSPDQVTTVVYGGVDDALLAAEPRSPDRRRYFLHVGHLERRKDLATLVSAYAFARRETDSTPRSPQLLLVGADHGEGPAIRRRANELGVGDDVRSLGTVDEEELRQLYAGATAVAIPSRYEGFGLPALEALAAGVPVLVADAGALPEVVGSVAEVLPVGNAEAWGRALIEVLRRPRDSGATEARKAHARAFGWRSAAAATLRIWRRAAGGTSTLRELHRDPTDHRGERETRQDH